MRRISINARLAHDEPFTDETEVVLVRITHPDLDEPVRISTDPTELLSVDPLVYGTYSKWLTEDGSPFLFVAVSTLLPDDQEDAPAAASIIIEMVDNRIVDVLRSTIDQAYVDMAIVLASNPNLVEVDWLGLRLVGVSGSSSEVTLQISREIITKDPWPADRMTKARFPGLHK